MSSPLGMQSPDFQHILRIMNTNVDGKRKVWVALTAIRGIGRRFAILVCRKADIDINRRAGELSNEEVEKITAIMAAPLNFKIPVHYLNRRRDIKDGQNKHVSANAVDATLRDDLERLKKIRCNRGLRHFWGFKVRGQHTKTTGRYGLSAHLAKLKK
eukprot:Protomagalhaensia_wolfi_Nauph_80__1236@NODE_172_length_3315_cov_306_166361_g129_i0_p4_GENE_NODE_172_length_3315_cov_306_166361_g129_i0NODE_172_length_3315_cov_306_166361_g129_i0_p4_ORF_typecomplete_len157_score30_15Ribosomal_S13/PF00416_22/3e46_NODE_172_length_3315_cov_306_166361_g129_i022152685